MDETDRQTMIDMEFESSLIGEFRRTFLAVKMAVGGRIGITQARLLIFQHLNASSEISQADLQRRLGVDGAVITRLVKQMEVEGLLTRRPDPADNRFTLVKLTTEGHRQIKQLLVKVKAIEPILLDGVSAEDIYCIRRVLERVRQNAEVIKERPL